MKKKKVLGIALESAKKRGDIIEIVHLPSSSKSFNEFYANLLCKLFWKWGKEKDFKKNFREFKKLTKVMVSENKPKQKTNRSKRYRQ